MNTLEELKRIAEAVNIELPNNPTANEIHAHAENFPNRIRHIMATNPPTVLALIKAYEALREGLEELKQKSAGRTSRIPIYSISTEALAKADSILQFKKGGE